MKLYFPAAYIPAVTNLMLKMGTGEDASLVPAMALSITAEVNPKMLDQLREGLSDVFFEPASEKAPTAPRVPSLPELAALQWKTEYECTLVLDISELNDLDFEAERLTFTGVEAKAISFEPLATGGVAMKLQVNVRADQEGRGQLSALLKHEVRVTLSKLSQKPLIEPDKPKDDAAKNQGRLPIGDGSTQTSDGEPITPLRH